MTNGNITGIQRRGRLGNTDYVIFNATNPLLLQKLAGAIAADLRDGQLLDILYPFSFFRNPPKSIIELEIQLDNIASAK